MSTVTPPPPPSAPPPAPASQPTLTVQAPPPSLSRLPVGSKIEVQIIPAGDKGTNQGQSQIQIQTPVGKLTVQSTIPLPPNGTITLQVTSHGSLAQFLILSIDGKNPAAFSRALPGPIGNAGTGTLPFSGLGAAQGTSGAPVQLNIGQGLTATLLGSGNTPLTSSPLTGQAQPGGGTQTGVPVSTPTPPIGAASSAQTTTVSPVGQQGLGKPTGAHLPANAVPGHTSQSGTVSTTQPFQATSASLPGPQFGVKITGMTLPGGTLPSLPSASSGLSIPTIGQTITGIVTGQTANGQPVINTHLGQVALSTKAPLAQNTVLELEVVRASATLQGATGPQDTSSQARLAFLHGQKWEGLDQALKGLEETNPTIAQHLSNVLIPRANSSLAIQLLFFIVALRGGDLKNWIGDGPLRALEKLKPGMLDQLKSDFRAMSQAASEADKPDGRALTVPFLHNNEIDKIRIWSHSYGREDNDQNEDQDQGTRFVVDFSLSSFGRIQLDGNVRSGDSSPGSLHPVKTHFDLFIRSDNPLPDEARETIRTIFTNANDTTGSIGGVAFQAAPANFFTIPTVSDETSDSVGLVI